MNKNEESKVEHDLGFALHTIECHTLRNILLSAFDKLRQNKIQCIYNVLIFNHILFESSLILCKTKNLEISFNSVIINSLTNDFNFAKNKSLRRFLFRRSLKLIDWH